MWLTWTLGLDDAGDDVYEGIEVEALLKAGLASLQLLRTQRG